MPLTKSTTPKFNPGREAVVSWDGFRKGLNLLMRENEIDGKELTLATNLRLKGSGIPTKRWGDQKYFVSSPTSSHQTRFLMAIKDAEENREVLAFSDWGFLVKKSGASYAMITGASWASGTRMEGTQLGGNVYLVSDDREFVRYDFSTLTSFPTIATPSGALITNLSGASGTNTQSWRITATSRAGGETIASTPVSLASLPQDLTKTVMQLSWTAVSAASGDLLGYNIYRGTPGDELWVGGVDTNTLSFDDYGNPSPDPFRVVPTADTTGGPKAKYIIRFQDRLILAGIPGAPTKVLVSGRWPYQERFDWYAGGGYVLIEPDSGQHITGLGIHQEKLVVFKENSVWQVNLGTLQFGQYTILDPTYKLLTASQGCSSHRSIVPVENDLMFANRKGVYILRYEPQLLTILNANEISAKIKPFFDGLTDDDHTHSNADYIDKQYVISFPYAKKTIAFDRERLCFMGPWTTPFGINQWMHYVDDVGMERWLAADTDNEISEFQRTLQDDKGTAIETILKTKKEDFGDWTIFKTVTEAFFNFRAVQGNVNVNIYIEDRNGRTIVAKAFTLTGTGSSGTAGFGTDAFGTTNFGVSEFSATAADDETMRKAGMYKSSRIFQVEIRTNGRTDNYELLNVKALSIPQARGNAPSQWRI